jgi:DNA primase
MENVDPKNGADLHKVARKLQERFCPGATPDVTAPAQTKPARVEPAQSPLTVINAPLDFQLKGLDQTHPYLRSRGFTPETIARFGLGFCSRGSLKDRVAIPLHDHKGKLVGYAGRVVDDAAISEDNPRYRFPGKRERNGVLYEFRKTQFLYNGYRMETPVDDLIVVEGFMSVWWLHQNGLTQVVATMGADCSDRQAELVVSLVNPNGRVWLMPDGDDAGERFAAAFLTRVAPDRFTRWVKLEAGRQPTDYTGEELNRMLGKGGAT